MLDSNPWTNASTINLISNLTEAEIKSMSFNAGSFFWVSNQTAKQLRLCAYNEKYNSVTNQC